MAAAHFRKSDLDAYSLTSWDRPIEGTYGKFTIQGVPGPTGAVTLIELMNILGETDVARLEPDDPDYLHFLIEAIKLTFADRWSYVGGATDDNGYFGELTSKEHARDRMSQIHSRRAAEYPPTQIRPNQRDAHTSHISVVDRQGNAASLTQSIIELFGSGVVAPHTGILMNSAMRNFTSGRGRPNSAQPGGRAAHHGTPIVVTGPEGKLKLVAGGAGGSMIVTGLAQTSRQSPR